MKLISFNIRLEDKFDLVDFIELAESTYSNFITTGLSFEYTTDLENITYEEKEFDTFDSFKNFWNSSEFRFDNLKLIGSEEEFIGFQQSRNDLRIYGSISSKSFITDLIKEVEHNIVYAYIHDRTDHILSRSTRPRSWKRYLGSIPEYLNVLENPQSTSERDKYIIDLESNPSHQHQILNGDRLWFGAFAEMYFAPIYYKYIPKDKWDNFHSCKANEILNSGVRRIVLYDNLEEFDAIHNRTAQSTFRKELGIDDVAHGLVKN